jgi:hypothetical protein
MLLTPLHGTLDLHDGLATLAVAGTIAMASLLSTLRGRARRGGLADRGEAADNLGGGAGGD